MAAAEHHREHVLALGPEGHVDLAGVAAAGSAHAHRGGRKGGREGERPHERASDVALRGGGPVRTLPRGAARGFDLVHALLEVPKAALVALQALSEVQLRPHGASRKHRQPSREQRSPHGDLSHTVRRLPGEGGNGREGKRARERGRIAAHTRTHTRVPRHV
eukprot:COSAG03_NODE_1836_length_3455_cov_60.297974_2_plen_162_part_00